jgi:hypothetical protein
MKTLLFLAGGSQVAQFILTCLQGRRESLRLIATTSLADDPGLWQYDKVFLVPPTARQAEAFKQRVQDIIDREGADLVIPCRDDDTVALAEMADAQPALSPRALCGPGTLARALHDKWASALLCREHGLPYVESWIEGGSESAEAFAARVGYPLVVKPRDGFNSHGVFVIDTPLQLARALARGHQVVQEYLGEPQRIAELKRSMQLDGLPLRYSLRGEKPSIQLMFSPRGEHVASFATLNAQGFASRQVRPTADAETLALTRQCGAVFARLGWRGPINVQCERDARGRLRIHEFNARYSASTAERCLLGYDEVALGIELFTGLVLPGTRWFTRPARRVVSQMSPRAVDPADADALQEHGWWARAAAP